MSGWRLEVAGSKGTRRERAVGGDMCPYHPEKGEICDPHQKDLPNSKEEAPNLTHMPPLHPNSQAQTRILGFA